MMIATVARRRLDAPVDDVLCVTAKRVGRHPAMIRETAVNSAPDGVEQSVATAHPDHQSHAKRSGHVWQHFTVTDTPIEKGRGEERAGKARWLSPERTLLVVFGPPAVFLIYGARQLFERPIDHYVEFGGLVGLASAALVLLVVFRRRTLAGEIWLTRSKWMFYLCLATTAFVVALGGLINEVTHSQVPFAVAFGFMVFITISYLIWSGRWERGS